MAEETIKVFVRVKADDHPAAQEWDLNPDKHVISFSKCPYQFDGVLPSETE